MGTTEDVFQSVGGRPHAIEQLNNFVSDGNTTILFEFKFNCIYIICTNFVVMFA